MPTREPESARPLEARLCCGHPLRLRHAAGDQVEVGDGIVWITVEGVADDFFVGAGGVFVLPGDGLTLVEAIESARVRVLAAGSTSDGVPDPDRFRFAPGVVAD